MSPDSVHLIDTNQSECEGVNKQVRRSANLITTLVQIIGCELHAL